MASTDGTPAPKGRAPHRRDENARIAVLHAADDLLVERGFGGVTIEGIAARAGVAKQTIYRWWPSKVDILLDTLIEDASRHLAIPDAGSAVESARRYLRTTTRWRPPSTSATSTRSAAASARCCSAVLPQANSRPTSTSMPLSTRSWGRSSTAR
jgi:AcrR family transcriptional regulator